VERHEVTILDASSVYGTELMFLWYEHHYIDALVNIYLYVRLFKWLLPEYYNKISSSECVWAG